MIYKQFHIGRFRGVADVTVSLAKGDLVLLVGLNESGKTTILRALEAFDHRNDPEGDYYDAFLESVRPKADEYTNESGTVTAEIEISRTLKVKDFLRAIHPKPSKDQRGVLEDFVRGLNKSRKVALTRVFPFKEGRAQIPFYRIASDHALTTDQDLASTVGARLVELCPFILYFEDFTDRIPDKIFVSPRNSAYDPDWYDIIDGLFFHTQDNYSISKFKQHYSASSRRARGLDDAGTVINRVNATLNRVFTDQWVQLSGVKDIKQTLLIAEFHGQGKHFQIKISEHDGTTYSVHERSKGALWYLSFLMRTEFRRKKMRRESGKPIFLIDEPASNLHSSAQETLLGDFRELVKDTSVIYTTHSQYLVQRPVSSGTVRCRVRRCAA